MRVVRALYPEELCGASSGRRFELDGRSTDDRQWVRAARAVREGTAKGSVFERHGSTVEGVAKLHARRHTRPALDRPRWLRSGHHKAGHVAHEEEQAPGPQHQASGARSELGVTDSHPAIPGE